MPEPSHEAVAALEQRVTELTGLLQIAFVSICSLQAQVARAEHAREARRANAAAMERIREIGIWEYMHEVGLRVLSAPEHPLVEEAVHRARVRRGGNRDSRDTEETQETRDEPAA